MKKQEQEYQIVEEQIKFCGEIIKYKRLIRPEGVSLANCSKNIERNIKENHKALRLSMQESDKDVLCN